MGRRITQLWRGIGKRWWREALHVARLGIDWSRRRVTSVLECECRCITRSRSNAMRNAEMGAIIVRLRFVAAVASAVLLEITADVSQRKCGFTVRKCQCCGSYCFLGVELLLKNFAITVHIIPSIRTFYFLHIR